MKVILAACLLILPGICRSQDLDTAACTDTTILGEVENGDRFEVEFGDSLRFVLDPTIGPPNPDGWTIRILGREPDHDFLMVATPPYRFGNPRYLDTSYGHTAEQTVAWAKRSFSFVMTEDDFQKMHAAIGVLLWSAGHDSTEIEEARYVTESVDKGKGLFRVMDSDTSPPSDESPLGRIERVVFEVDLCRD